MPKQKHNRFSFVTHTRRALPLFIMTLVLVGASLSQNYKALAASCSSAADCQQQIDNLRNQNAQAQNSLNGLEAQASSYQDAMYQLQTQIAALQQQISANQAQQAQLQQQIVDAQTQLDQQKSTLANDIKALYVGGQITPIEMLATSSDLSDYVDKQEAYSAVQDKIQSTLQQIAALQQTLQTQKAQVDALLATLQAQNTQLSNAEYQQAQLLAYNQDQQNQFNGQIAANKAQITALQKQQFLYNVQTYGRAQYGGTGNYPWADARQVSGTYTWVEGNGEFDPMGWSYRNCTSYAFWRLAQVRGIQLPWSDFMNVYYSGGKIGYSIPDFQALGYGVDHNPDGATLAVNGAGPYGTGYYGHIMFVESSNGDSAYVSQYNYAGDGNYSTMTIHPSSTTWFIHIP